MTTYVLWCDSIISLVLMKTLTFQSCDLGRDTSSAITLINSLTTNLFLEAMYLYNLGSWCDHDVLKARFDHLCSVGLFTSENFWIARFESICFIIAFGGLYIMTLFMQLKRIIQTNYYTSIWCATYLTRNMMNDDICISY